LSIPYWSLKSLGLFSFPTLFIIHCKESVQSSLVYINSLSL
jgi:hypothetical protein